MVALKHEAKVVAKIVPSTQLWLCRVQGGLCWYRYVGIYIDPSTSVKIRTGPQKGYRPIYKAYTI